MGLGRKGLRVANTPLRLVPPRRGGLTVGNHFSVVPRLFSVCTSLAISAAVPPGVPFSNSQMSHRYVKPSIPSTAEFRANSGSKMMVPRKCGARKLFRGMPNFCGMSVWMCAIGFMAAILPQRKRAFVCCGSDHLACCVWCMVLSVWFCGVMPSSQSEFCTFRSLVRSFRFWENLQYRFGKY